MRSLRTPAVLATLGLCGLGAAFAQGPILSIDGHSEGITNSPMSIEPTPADYPAPSFSSPSYDSPSFSGPTYDSPGTPGPVDMGPPLEMESPLMNSSPARGSCDGCNSQAPPVMSAPCESTPCESTPCESAPCQSGCAAPMAPAAACGCQGGMNGGNSFNQYSGSNLNQYGGASYGSSYSMGSGSGVSSGILTPASNSGGLHTRYPYYNYRAPWFYQGPPSQNVTIVW